MPRLKKGSPEAKAYMAKLRASKSKNIPDRGYQKIKLNFAPIKKIFGIADYKKAPASVKKLVDSLENMYDPTDIKKVVTALARKGYYIEISMDGSVEVFRKIKKINNIGMYNLNRTIFATPNKTARTFTLKIVDDNGDVVKYRTSKMNKEEFNSSLYNTQRDWHEFLKSDDYYKISGTTTKKPSSIHKDTKSHNVNIKVVSGMKKNKNVGSVYENLIPTGKKMYARIDDLAYVYTDNGKMKDYLKQNANKWVEIDTKFLFSDQYNTIDNYRIYDTMINAIKNDARLGIKQFENDDSCCFLIWKGIKPEPLPLPESIDKIAKRVTQWKNPTYKIGSYEFESMFLKHYKLQNARQRIKFLYWNKMYFTTSGIGYKAKKSLSLGYPILSPVPDNVKKKVDQILNSL